jgi:hypothetical protein
MRGPISRRQLFAECPEDGSANGLCVDSPREIAKVVWPIAMALLIKGALTIITFGIKLPGSSTDDIRPSRDDAHLQPGFSFLHSWWEPAQAGLRGSVWNGSNTPIPICPSSACAQTRNASCLGCTPWSVITSVTTRQTLIIRLVLQRLLPV